jgi:hypothetical protein
MNHTVPVIRIIFHQFFQSELQDTPPCKDKPKTTGFHNPCYVYQSNERAAENRTFCHKLTTHLPLLVVERAMDRDTIIIRMFEERMCKDISFETGFIGAKLHLSC